jgi:hypothetical protein
VKLALVVLAAWLLGGCSAMRMVYDSADTWVSWRAGSFLNLAGEDADELEKRIDELHAWHRAKALPQYARLAEEAARRMGDGLSPADAVWGYDSLVAQTKELLRAGAESFGPLLDRVGPEQAAQMEKGFADDNRKFAREFLRGSEAERRKKRVKRAVDRLEDWVGRLNGAQVERIEQYSQRAPLLDDLRDRDRRRIQADILAIVRARESQKRLAERLVNWERGREPAFVASNKAWRDEYFAMLVDVDRMLTAEQRARAITRFRSFAEDFDVLSRAAKPQ